MRLRVRVTHGLFKRLRRIQLTESSIILCYLPRLESPPQISLRLRLRVRVKSLRRHSRSASSSEYRRFSHHAIRRHNSPLPRKFTYTGRHRGRNDLANGGTKISSTRLCTSPISLISLFFPRSEERRVGKECLL